ncbi:MAG: hypothetical protein ACRDEA_10155 [Microcystaceae cyanobacterium]
MSSMAWATRTSPRERLVSWSAKSQRNSKLLNFKTMDTPLFKQEQQVCFIGGSGTVKSCHLDSGTWIYSIEMLLEPERPGYASRETAILLEEAELQAC